MPFPNYNRPVRGYFSYSLYPISAAAAAAASSSFLLLFSPAQFVLGTEDNIHSVLQTDRHDRTTRLNFLNPLIGHLAVKKNIWLFTSRVSRNFRSRQTTPLRQPVGLSSALLHRWTVIASNSETLIKEAPLHRQRATGRRRRTHLSDPPYPACRRLARSYRTADRR